MERTLQRWASEIQAEGHEVELRTGQWFKYSSDDDRWGLDEIHMAQTDALMLLGDSVLIIECKLSYVPSAFVKLVHFYAPIVRAAFPQVTRVSVVQIFKNHWAGLGVPKMEHVEWPNADLVSGRKLIPAPITLGMLQSATPAIVPPLYWKRYGATR